MNTYQWNPYAPIYICDICNCGMNLDELIAVQNIIGLTATNIICKTCYRDKKIDDILDLDKQNDTQ